ncbi:autophagy-related protein 11 [Acrasis kona]|uniref:Autophagy-related protein 11 n=1 Tax=Acrasis kona TaxID=1008807 RepID=A0AAW2YP00_9EUKA
MVLATMSMNTIPIPSRSRNFSDEINEQTLSSMLSNSVPNNTNGGQMRMSELSASLARPSHIHPVPQNQYRNIKARYFQSLKLSSPLQNKLQQEKQVDEECEKSKPASPIPIPSNSTLRPIPQRTVSENATPFAANKEVIENTSAPVSIKARKPGPSVAFKDEDDEDDFSLSTTYDDPFMFESTYKEQPLMRSRSQNINTNKPRPDYLVNNSVMSYAPFQPPHLMNQRSDFSLYRQGQKRNIQRQVEKFV